jgi:phosphate transport system permease protein
MVTPMTKTFDPAQLKRRYAAEKRFKALGLAAVLLAASFVFLLLGDVILKSIPAFTEYRVSLAAKPDGNDTYTPYKEALQALLKVETRQDRRKVADLISIGEGSLLSSQADLYLKGMIVKTEKIAGLQKPNSVNLTQIEFANGKATRITGEKREELVTTGMDKTFTLMLHSPEEDRKISDKQAIWLEMLREKGLITQHFNTRFFINGDSREPELAGLRGALIGSLYTVFVTLLLCLPLGIAAAIYLQEFAPTNKFTDLLEVNINNLAAVPSIVFGILGLAIFLNVFGLPRSASLVGGLVLALMILPTIIIATRTAMGSVPPSIKQAALGLGASHMQAVFHHVLPLSLPGIMTGTIMGLARALGETAPLLMIGMVAFIVDIPQKLTDPATVLPVQIYLWSDLPEAGFVARTSATIVVLLGVLLCLNAIAVFIRNRYERRW